jgi:ferric-dicitrate binding protein FerR (iron transport regulator)
VIGTPRVLIVVAGVWAAGLVTACSGCRRSDALAELTEQSGTVQRDHAKAVGTWEAAPVHAQFYVGDGVKSGQASRAILDLSDKSELVLEQNTQIRFLDSPPGSGEHRFDLEMGQATVQSGAEAFKLRTSVGVAVIDPGSRVVLEKGDKGMHYEVSVGNARFEAGGNSTDVHAGEGIAIGIGAAQIVRDEPKKKEEPAPAPAPTPTESSAPAPEEAPSGGGVEANVKGAGASVKSPGATSFTKLKTGAAEIESGSTLRLANGTSVDVERGGQRATLKGAGEFVIGESGKPLVFAQAGSVALSNEKASVSVAVRGGTIVADLGSSATLNVKKDGTKVAVSAGTVHLSTDRGTEDLHAGQEGTVAPKGETEVVGRGPGYVDFAAPAGGSFAVHDPSPPTAVGFAIGGACSGEAVVELKGKAGTRSAGSGTVSILVPAGSHKYEIHCAGPGGIDPHAASSGTVAVMRDGGTARLPRTAASTLVDTDGRNYTVLYQSLLPKITVRWPNAPQSSGYTLDVASPGGTKSSYSAGAPSYAFQSGALREGTHRVTFASASTRSKTTSIDIKFDNASPTATITSPANGSFGPGSAVTVSGVALEGWKVFAGGKELSLDAAQRFSAEAVVPGNERALAIEFVNPRRGVHYYLRRSSGH